MLERLSPMRRNLVLLALGSAFLWFAWTVRSVLNPVILGYLLAYVLHPLVESLSKRGWSRRTAVNVIFVTAGLLFLVSGFALWWQGKELWGRVTEDQSLVQQVGDRVNAGLADLQAKLEEWQVLDPELDAEGNPMPRQALDVRAVWELFRSSGGDVQGVGSQAASGLFGALKGLFGSIVSIGTLLFLLPIYTYFLLFELGRIHTFVRRYLPGRERERISRIGAQIGEVLASFFRGRLVVCGLKGALLALGLWFCGCPYAMLLGFLSGVLALVPIVGPVLGFLLALMLAMLDMEIGQALLRVGIVYGAAEIVEGYLLIPKVLGDSLGLHPVVVIMALTIGGAALGLFGLLLALPLTATAIILVRELVLPALRALAEDAPKAPGASP